MQHQRGPSHDKQRILPRACSLPTNEEDLRSVQQHLLTKVQQEHQKLQHMLGEAGDVFKEGAHSFSFQVCLQHQCWHVQPLLSGAPRGRSSAKG